MNHCATGDGGNGSPGGTKDPPSFVVDGARSASAAARSTWTRPKTGAATIALPAAAIVRSSSAMASARAGAAERARLADRADARHEHRRHQRQRRHANQIDEDRSERCEECDDGRGIRRPGQKKAGGESRRQPDEHACRQRHAIRLPTPDY
jgi:hypothetical protein